LCSGLPEPFYVNFYATITKNTTVYNFTSNTSANLETSYHKCEWYDPTEIYSYWFIAYEVMIPFFFMVIFSTLSIMTIFESRNKLKENSKRQNASSQSRSSSSTNSSATKKSGIKSKDFKFAITSIALNVTFLLFVFPTNFLDILVYFISFDFDLAYVISEMFYHLNFAVVFFINYYFNSIFKNEFNLIIRGFFGISGQPQRATTISSISRSTVVDDRMML
jgi:hypothetical protein